MNNRGFAISGILYSILALFLMLLLLILGNFQSRKVTFDKQKDNVLDKLENRMNVDTGEFCYNSQDKEFLTPNDGTYLLEIYSSNNGPYISGKIKLYQGIKFFITVGKNSSDVTSIRTEENKVNSEIIGYRNNSTFAYTSGTNTDISLDYIFDTTIDSKSQSKCPNSGYVKISRIGD